MSAKTIQMFVKRLLMIRKVLHKQYKPPTDTPDCRFMCRIAFEKILLDFFSEDLLFRINFFTIRLWFYSIKLNSKFKINSPSHNATKTLKNETGTV